jgi:hypothetical protein
VPTNGQLLSGDLATVAYFVVTVNTPVVPLPRFTMPMKFLLPLQLADGQQNGSMNDDF